MYANLRLLIQYTVHVGSKVEFSTRSAGLAFYAVTRPVKAVHPNLKDREEGVQKKGSKL